MSVRTLFMQGKTTVNCKTGKFPLQQIDFTPLILALGLTDIISGMPAPPGKMKKANAYVQ